ncbi:histidine kinase [Tenacibaculum aiptasiae]|uniref:sensor histidine kinase n=1 Tax=Tenacibaculum aiptasiae TaxID=426481 RepID=UPI00232BB4CB|nr:histidine kinase [Tenacibaculum aiptasiae]
MIKWWLKRFKIISFLWLIIISIHCLSQNKINEISIADSGISSSQNKILFIDSSGFIWHNSLNGVTREMGNQREFYKLKTKKGNIINEIYDFIETKNGLFWALTEFGAFEIDPIKGVIQCLNPTEKIGEKRDSWFNSAYEDSNDNIWLGSSTGIFYCITPNKEIKKYSFNVPLPKKQLFLLNISKILNVTNLHVTFLTYNGIYKGKLDDSKKITFFPFPNSFTKKFEKSNKSYNYYCLNFSKNSTYQKNYYGKFKLGKEEGEYFYNKNLKTLIFQLPFFDSTIKKVSKNSYKLIATDTKKLYLGTLIINNGVPILKNNSFNTFNVSIKKVQLYNNTIIGINPEKIYCFQLYNNSFNRFLNNKNNLISTRGIIEDDSLNTYVAAHYGLYKKANTDSVFSKIELKNVSNNDFFYNGKIYDIEFINNKTKVILYGFTNRLYDVNLKNNTYTEHLLFNELKLKFPPTIIDILNIKYNELLLATTNGLYEYNLSTRKLTYIGNLSPTIYLNKEINYLFLDKENNNLWIGGLQGLYRKNLITKETITYLKNDNSNLDMSKSIRVITKDSYGNIWAGSRDGLYEISAKSNYKKIELKDFGLKNNNIVGLIPNGKFLWISTYNGLIQLNIDNSLTNKYYEKDGMPHNEFNAKSFYKAKNGTLYFGGLNGIVNFNPDELIFNPQKSSIYCSYIQKYNPEEGRVTRTRMGLSNKPKKIKLSYNHNSIEMGFALKNSVINNANDNLFFYKLSYYDNNEWTKMENTSSLRLRDLPSGNHTLEIKGYDNEGKQSNHLKYNIFVSQIFYKTTWFYYLCALLILLSLYLFYQHKKNRIHEKYLAQIQIVKQESKALRAQMNPHFISNALNGIQSVLIFDGVKVATHYIQIFSKLFRTTLDMTGSEWTFLKDEISYLKNYIELEEMRFEKKLNTVFNISPEININYHKIPCMLIQPIIENAIIHGLSNKEEDWRLTIDFSMIDDYIQIKVIDNGVGRAAAKINRRKKRRSWSTEILKDRISGYNSIHEKKMRLQIIDLHENGTASGTKVVLNIPTQNNMT